MPQTRKKRKYVFLFLICAAIIAAAGVIMFSPVPVKPFRIHILANSDGAADQQVKLSVRDAVINACAQGIKDCKNAAQAEEYIRNNLGIIIETADGILKEKGFAYRASATVGKYRFPERTYGNVVYPQGEYEAVRIMLGEGKGANWWCVIFPPLCLSGQDGADARYTSLFAELWEDIFGEPPIR